MQKPGSTLLHMCTSTQFWYYYLLPLFSSYFQSILLNGKINFFQFSRCYARLCGRNANILQQSLTLIDRARSISPKNAEFVNEAAYQLLLKDKYSDSVKYYRQAMKIDESSVQVGEVRLVD